MMPNRCVLILIICIILKVYVRLHDKPLPDSNAEEQIDTENLSPKELKKLRSKQRRAQKKAQQKEEEKQKLEDKKQSKKQQDAELDGPKEEELVPDKLARVSGFFIWDSSWKK